MMGKDITSSILDRHGVADRIAIQDQRAVGEEEKRPSWVIGLSERTLVTWTSPVI